MDGTGKACRLNRIAGALVVVCTSALAVPLAARPQSMPATHVSDAALAAAGRHAALKSIDYGESRCDGDMSVAAWLTSLAGRNARAITWTGGVCRLVNDMRPGIDASSWPWCAQATITLAHPKSRDDMPVVEIYLDAPVAGREGAARAFRSIMMTRDDGWDYQRGRRDFEALWRERFPSTAAGCRDEE